jgi:hypothetical protein
MPPPFRQISNPRPSNRPEIHKSPPYQPDIEIARRGGSEIRMMAGKEDSFSLKLYTTGSMEAELEFPCNRFVNVLLIYKYMTRTRPAINTARAFCIFQTISCWRGTATSVKTGVMIFALSLGTMSRSRFQT